MPKISSYSSVRYNVGWNSLFFPTVHVNFWIASFQESLPNVKVCTVGKQCNLAHYIYCLVIWTGSFTQGVDPFYKELPSADKRSPVQTASEARTVNLLWHIKHSTYTFVLTVNPSGLLLFIKKVHFFSSSSMWFYYRVYPAKWIQNSYVWLKLRKRDTLKLFQMLQSLKWQVSNTFPRLEGLPVSWLFRKPEVWVYKL